ncbi:hypothetical protein [Microvirga makkahensis]|uniref:Inner membrane protein n=1 Tax=Microvirga makkahensis TaxID=1128670 RepID=A0A7X3MWK5_9HYPH|nr:hypothetical protein [Microvirga makkahensis]MXQ14551.1 hypothetical protein [Microvirga makkahensis]
MTDSSDPKAPKNSRKKRSREPATIDLKATVIDEGAQQDKAWDAVKPEDTIVPEASAPAEDTLHAENAPGTEDALRPEDTLGTAEATLDSGRSADSIEPATASDEVPPQPAEQPPQPDRQEDAPQGTPSAPAPVPERRTSAGALIGSGLLGGLVGAGLLYGLERWQQPPVPQDDQRLVQLEQRVAALGQPRPESQNADLSPAEERLQALESARDSLDQRLQEIQETARRAASQAEEALNRPLPEPAAPPPQNDAALADLSSRLSAVENAVATLQSEGQARAQSATEMSNAVQDLSRRLDEQSQRLDQRLNEQSQSLDQRLNEQSQSLDQRLNEQSQRLDERLAALSRQVAETSRTAEETGQTGTRVVLTGRLNDALRSGAPYADVLEGLRRAGADAGRLKPLEPFAGEGAPTASAMRESFEALEPQILRDERAASGEWSDRVLRMLDNVVTVRPVNEPDAAGVAGTVARIRQALDAGDMQAAAAAWASLPEPARRISEEWGQQATALAEARQAARDLSAEALAALNRSTQ